MMNKPSFEIKLSEAQLAQLIHLSQNIHKCAEQFALAVIPVMQEASKGFDEFGKACQAYMEQQKKK